MPHGFVMPKTTGPLSVRLFLDAVDPYIPAGHLDRVRASNRAGQADVRAEVEGLMQNWTFEE